LNAQPPRRQHDLVRVPAAGHDRSPGDSQGGRGDVDEGVEVQRRVLDVPAEAAHAAQLQLTNVPSLAEVRAELGEVPLVHARHHDVADGDVHVLRAQVVEGRELGGGAGEVVDGLVQVVAQAAAHREVHGTQPGRLQRPHVD